MSQTVNKIIEQIAKEKLGVDTLESRGSDRLDFHDLGVRSIKAALEEAFDAGYRMCAEVRG